MLLKAVYTFSATPIEILVTAFTEIGKTILKFVENHTQKKKPHQKQKPGIANAVFRRENKHTNKQTNQKTPKQKPAWTHHTF